MGRDLIRLLGNDSVDAYHANSYPFPGRAPDYRMSNGLSSAPPFSTDFRSSHSLPPVPGLASSSRGSSLDIETERPLNPSVYSSHHSSRPSSATLSDHDHRGPSHSQDYRYPQSTYRSSSPGSYSQHGHPPYYSHSYGPLSGSQPGDSRGVHSTDGRSPFSPTGSNCELAMDHYDQDRTLDRKRRRGNLPKQVTDLLRSWLNDHIHHPYPTEDEKQMLMAQTGLTIHQVSGTHHTHAYPSPECTPTSQPSVSITVASAARGNARYPTLFRG